MPMKTTIKAQLINVLQEQIEIISHMMLVWCSAMRYAFNQIQRGVPKGDLEKEIAGKYNLNIRQSKDAVEEARQTIAGQSELVKMYHKDWSKKVKQVENEIKAIDKKLNNKKIKPEEVEKLGFQREGKVKKLEKRQKKLKVWQNHIDNSTIPKVIFGTKQLFYKKCANEISNQEWKDARNNRFVSRGDRTKTGNPNLRIINEHGESFLEISTLEKTKSNRAVKIRVPLYLPQKLSKKSGKVNGRNYRQMVLDYLEAGEAYQIELIKRDNRFYVHITINENYIKDFTPIYTAHNRMVGIDTNPDGFALTLLDRKGAMSNPQYTEHIYIKQHELLYARSNRREILIGEMCQKVVQYAIKHEAAVAIEDLKFENDRDLSHKLNRKTKQFVYRKLLEMLEAACIRARIEVIKVAPQYTSKIGNYKYQYQYNLNIHNAAALVIGRRAYGIREKIPKAIRNRFLYNIDSEKSFNKKNEWGQWGEISGKIKAELNKNYKNSRKGKGFVVNRKKLLGIA
jgi:IS605 OrfB family transposase